MAFENYKIAVLSLAAAQERLAKEEEAKGDAKKRAFHKQWLKRGAANYGHRWQFFGSIWSHWICEHGQEVHCH